MAPDAPIVSVLYRKPNAAIGTNDRTIVVIIHRFGDDGEALETPGGIRGRAAPAFDDLLRHGTQSTTAAARDRVTEVVGPHARLPPECFLQRLQS